MTDLREMRSVLDRDERRRRRVCPTSMVGSRRGRPARRSLGFGSRVPDSNVLNGKLIVGSRRRRESFRFSVWRETDSIRL